MGGTGPGSFNKQKVLRPQEARGMNSALILRLLRSGGRLSRADIARSTGLSEGTVSRIVWELIERDLVVEDGAENSTGGRPATRLQLSSERTSLGVDIGSWETRFAFGTIRGEILESGLMRTPSRPEDMLESIVRKFQERQGPDRIGISIRGIVDSESGVVEMGHNPQWVRVRVREYLQSRLGVPVFVENNVRAAAVAEYQQTGPLLQASRSLLYVLIDEGVGVGILLDGKLYHGPRMAAGEFGQMVIAYHDGPERHDRPGSFENLVSNSAICDRYSALCGGRSTGAGRDSAARVRRICQDARNGDANAVEALRITGRYIGVALANLVWGLDPDTIVISSSLDSIWPMLLGWVKEQFPPSDVWPTFRNLQIQQSTLGERGPLLGAAMLPFAEVFQNGELITSAVRS